MEHNYKSTDIEFPSQKIELRDMEKEVCLKDDALCFLRHGIVRERLSVTTFGKSVPSQKTP